MSSTALFLAIDVGTGSVRAALFDKDGQKLAYCTHDIKTRNVCENYYEQSSDDIWRAVCFTTKYVCKIINQHESDAMHVAAIGIDATCSLVACSAQQDHKPISVVPHPDDPLVDDIYNVILWLDRRGINEAAMINELEDASIAQVRSHFGDIISPENEPPKLLWLKKNKPEIIEQAIFFDLADWVAFKCHGNPYVRSTCTVACKWGWGSNEESEGKWNDMFWKKLGLDSLVENDFYKIGSQLVKPGLPLGTLTSKAAEDLGLSTDCVVASAMIDAHAGALWSLGINPSSEQYEAQHVEQRLSVICGTSTCFIQHCKQPLFIRGVWGPFRDAVLPGYYITEGGQSVTGKLLENTVKMHAAYSKLVAHVGADNVYEELARITENCMNMNGVDPAQHVHCLDYHAGNRSPRADPTLKGMMTGLSLNEDEFDLAVKFRATIQAICYGARHIIETMQQGGHDIKLITICGGLCKSELFLRELADSINIPVLQSGEVDTVLVGGGIVAQCAMKIWQNSSSDLVQTLMDTAKQMTKTGQVTLPNAARKDFHDRKYAVYHQMFADFSKYRNIMDGK